MTNKEINYKNIYYPPGGILIWMLIILELITFGLALVFFIINSKENPALFHQSKQLLNPAFGAVNTVFLLTSGYFMATSVHHFSQNNSTKASLYLNLTMLGGILFLALKSVEYTLKIQHGYTIGFNSFFTYYWLLTGFHVIHVIVGLFILLFMQYSLKKRTLESEDFHASAAFWHMCDLIWLLLFPTLYLIL